MQDRIAILHAPISFSTRNSLKHKPLLLYIALVFLHLITLFNVLLLLTGIHKLYADGFV